MLIGIGLALLAICLLVGRIAAGASGMAMGARAFMPIWLFVALGNLGIGVAFGGASLMAELLLLVLVFAPLALLAEVLALASSS